MSKHTISTDFTRTEELLHALTHGIGAILAIGALLLMVSRAAAIGSLATLAVTIHGVSLLAVYLASTLYHAAPWPQTNRVFQIFDHVAIFFLIAGTYTPFALVTLHGTIGWTVLAIIWTLALVGTTFELLTHGKRTKISLGFYIAMGWVAVFFIKPLSEALSTIGIWALVAGGLFYTIGAVFYAWKKFPYNHVVWHLFVIAGSASHVVCVLFGVLERG